MAGRINVKNLKRGVSYLKRNGISSAYYKAMERLLRDDDEADYDKQVRESILSSEEIIRQKQTVFDRNYLISIIVPAYNPDPDSFCRLLESVAAQTYTNWELCIVDASTTSSVMPMVHSFIARHGLDRDKRGNLVDYKRRVKYEHLERNRGISINTNEALKMAGGQYIALLDHDDALTRDALYEVVKAINKKKVRFIYSDEDKVSYDDGNYFDHHKKTDYDPAMLLTNNYVCHLTVVETELARQVGGFNPEFDGSQDYDFILRCFEAISPEEIVHIPKVLYHWRSSKASTAENPESKMYAYDAGISAVKAHLSRCGIDAELTLSEHLGFANVTFKEAGYTVKRMSRKEYEALDRDGFESILEEMILVLDDDLAASLDAQKLLLGPMCLPYAGAVTGKILKNGTIESCGYERIKGGGVKPCFAGMNPHYSGYLHRAMLLRCVDAFDNGCVMYKKAALTWDTDGTRLSDGYRCIYEPKAVFTRK